MTKKKNESKKVVDKIDPSSNVQKVLVNNILSYIEVLCHNKSVYYNTDTNNSYPCCPMFMSTHINTMTWENGEQVYKHGETMLLRYSDLIDDVE